MLDVKVIEFLSRVIDKTEAVPLNEAVQTLSEVREMCKDFIYVNTMEVALDPAQ